MRLPLLSFILCLNSLEALDSPNPQREEFVFSFQATFKEAEGFLVFRLNGKESHLLRLTTDRAVVQKSRGLFRKHKQRWTLKKGVAYKFLIQCRLKFWSLHVDGRRMMSVPREEGELSLSVEEVDSVAIKNTRMQPYETVHFADDFMRETNQGSGWKSQAGTWKLAKATQLEFAASPFRLQAVSGVNARCTKGFPFWRDYLFQASTRIHDSDASTGLSFYRLGDSEFLFRWNGEKRLFELLHRNGESEEILTTREGDIERQQWYRFGVAACGTQVRCFVDETEVLRANSDFLAQGGIGLYASHQSKPIEFDDVLVEGIPFDEKEYFSLKHTDLIHWLRSVQPKNEVINPTFVKDRYMQNWTSDSAEEAPRPNSEKTSTKNYYGYTFFRAPSDWWRTTGRWDAYSRWSCRPEWSFFSGTDDHLALIWNKRRFPGDLRVDIYAANPMVTMRPPFYGETSLNLTICGDGKNPFSGYTVSMGGWNKPVTKLYRQNKVVAVNTSAIIPVSQPSNYHREWFHLQLVKIGRRVEFSFEGKKIFEIDDAKPLQGDRVGIWSLESGVSIARAQIQFAEEGEMWAQFARQSKVKMAEGWETLDGDQGAFPAAREEKGHPIVRLINQRTGGTFAAAPPGLPINLAEHSVISFRYRTTGNANSNFYFSINDHWHRLRFTGPAETRLPVTKLGAVASVKTDGKWHHAQFDLLPALHRSHTKAPFVAKEIRIGLLEAGDLLSAGLGANQSQAYWDIADLKFSAAEEKTSSPTVNSSSSKLFEAFEHGIDNWENFGGPEGAMLFADQDAGISGTALQLYKKTHGGIFGARWNMATFHLENYPILEMDYRMPENVRSGLLIRVEDQWFSIVFSPTGNAQFRNQAAVTVVRDNQWHSLKIPLLELFSKTFPNQEARWVNEIIFSDQAERSPNGYRGNIKGVRYWIDNVRCLRGESTTIRKVQAVAPETSPLPAVTVRYPETLFSESFESGQMPWRDWCEGTVMHAAFGTFGNRCARIFGYRENAYFSTMMWEDWIDLDRYPIMSFDYRIPSTASIGFAINLDDYFYLLPFSRQVDLEKLNDKKKAEYVTVLVGDCIADDQWHSTEIDLTRHLRKRFPDRKGFRIRDLRTQTMGSGNPIGQSCYFDSVSFHSRKPGKVRFEWKTPPGTTQVKYGLNTIPAGTADKTAAKGTTQVAFQLKAGTYYFHLSVQKTDGGWSGVVQKKIVLQN